MTQPLLNKKQNYLLSETLAHAALWLMRKPSAPLSESPEWPDGLPETLRCLRQALTKELRALNAESAREASAMEMAQEPGCAIGSAR